MNGCYYEAVDIFGNVVGEYPMGTDYIDLFIQNKRIEKIIVVCLPPSNRQIMYHRVASHIQDQITKHYNNSCS